MREHESFFEKDRRYVYLVGSIFVGLNVLMWRWDAAVHSFLGASGALLCILAAVCLVFEALALIALAYKLRLGKGYGQCFLKRRPMVTLARCLYLAVLLCFALTLVDRGLIKLVELIQVTVSAEKNPNEFVPSMIYMFWKGRNTFLYGIRTTVVIALLGTVIAFILAVGMAFMRIQAPTRRDSDLTILIKKLVSSAASLYITVIRGTPMMVQALIIYYAGFGLLSGSGMTITEINGVWSYFTSGLITVSLNSTAYLAEVLRGGIESVDAGQTEAARSLGMTTWQAMLKVVFPQAVKNSIPAIGNEFIINIKDSSVLSVIGCMDLMFATTTVSGIYYRSLAAYCIAAVLYLILTYLSSLLMKAIAKKLDTPSKGIPSSN